MSINNKTNSKITEIKHQAINISLSILIKYLRKTPRIQRRTIMRNIGKTLLYFAKKTRIRAMANITNAMPQLNIKEVKELAFDAYANCAFGVAETFWLDQLEPEIFCDEDTLRILQSGQGACIATMHLGCYEAVPLAINKFSNHSVTLTNVPTFLEEGLQFYSAADITAINQKSPSAFTDLMKQANKNAYISLHCDLYANEAEVTFFNKKTKAPAGIALLALMTKQPLLLGYAIYQEDGKIQVFFETIIANTNDINTAPEHIMAQIYQRFENIIQQYPNQWYWSYKRWRK